MSSSPLDSRESVDPRLLENSKNILKALNPSFDPEHLNKMAEVVAKQTESISNSASSLEELMSYCQRVKRLCDENLPPNDQAQLQSTLLEFGIEKNKILNAKHLTVEQQVDSDLEQELNREISQATVRSIKKAQDLQQQTCKTCHTPNHLITIDSQDPQYLLKKCSRCKKVMYCSTACQSKDWPRHKKAECFQHITN